MALRMEQTTVNQYFQARKSSSSQASKRRKIDLSLEKKQLSSQASPATTLSKSISNPKRKPRRKLKSEKPSLTVSAIINAAPISFSKEELSKSETVASSDDHFSGDLKRKRVLRTPTKSESTSNQVLESPFKAASPKLSSQKAFKNDTDDYPVNNAINDQAKLVLFSRGNAFLKAGLSPRKIKSPVKASEVLQALSPRKILEENTKREQSSHLQRRSRLRAKFSDLLKADEARTRTLEAKETSSSASAEIKETTAVEADSLRITTSKRVRACDKYKHLVEKAVPSTFQLPDHYKLLLEMFRCTDSVLYLLNQRSETCTFEKLKKSVQSMCGREFSMKHLSMMKTVYPSGFTFRQEKGLHTSDGLNAKNMSFQLTIEANFKEVLTNPSSKLSSNVLITRRLKFENLLLAIVKEHHNRFLRKLNIDLNGKEIHRWHPRFKLNEVPDIEQANLPKPPVTKLFSTASDILLKSRGVLIPQVEKALKSTSENTITDVPTETAVDVKQTTDVKSSSENSTKPKSKQPTSSKSLLERIREKEQKKMQLAMTRDPMVEERLSQMSRLPEMCRILNSYLISEKKVAIPMEDCVKKLSESYGTALQINKIETHVRLIAELAPTWLSVALVRKCPYVKIKRNSDINKVLATLELRKKEEEKK